jgi:hypothetical protein|tara:strand:- start:1068 stop:1379 length:312 start_codon:yes stop_codon:yes gene_type:complete
MSCNTKHPHHHPPLWLVKVEWLDAATYNNGWHDLDDLPIENDYFESYGIHFLDDELCMYLTDTVRPDKCVGTIHQIPKGMIKKVTRIKKIKEMWKPKKDEKKT